MFRRRNLSTRIITTALIAAAAGLDAVLLVRLHSDAGGWGGFACLGAAAAITQLLMTRNSSSRRAHESIAVFIVAAALVLPPELVVLVPLAQHIPEWLKQRYSLTAQAAYDLLRHVGRVRRLGRRRSLLARSGAECEHNRRDSAGRPAGGHDLRARRSQPDRDRQARAGRRFQHLAIGDITKRARLQLRSGRTRRSGRSDLDLRLLAGSFRDRPTGARATFAHGAAPARGGTNRPEDGPLQRTPSRSCVRRRAGALDSLRPPALGIDGRPRSPARGQQHLWPSRRRRRPLRGSRCVPLAAASL